MANIPDDGAVSETSDFLNDLTRLSARENFDTGCTNSELYSKHRAVNTNLRMELL